VILNPRSQSGSLEPLASPISGAERLVEALKAKIAQAKATAAKQPKQPEAALAKACSLVDFVLRCRMSAFGGKVDMTIALRNVC
jgi:hypothetical protein